MERSINDVNTHSEVETASAETGILQQEGNFEFPAKPSEIKKAVPEQSKSLVSLLLFIVAFGFIYEWDFVYIGLLVAVLLVHEFGHYLAMKYYKYNDLSIFFIPLIGAAASGTKEQVSQKQQAIILLAGPVPGIIIGSVLFYISLQSDNELYTKMANLYIFINVFNLLPLLPLDGGRLIKTLFFNKNETITNIFLVLSIGLMTYIAINTASYLLLLIPFFLLLQINHQLQIKKLKKALAEKNIKTDQNYNELSDMDYWLIRNEIGTHVRLFQKSITPYHYVESEKEQDIIKQIKQLLNPGDIADMTVGAKVICTIVWVASFIIPFIAGFIYLVINKGHF